MSDTRSQIGDARYAAEFADSFHAARWYAPGLVERELVRKCAEIVADAGGRRIREVRFEVEYVDE